MISLFSIGIIFSRLDELRPLAQIELGDKGLADLVTALSGMLEVLPTNASKGAGLKALLQELNIQPNEVLALGMTFHAYKCGYVIREMSFLSLSWMGDDSVHNVLPLCLAPRMLSPCVCTYKYFCCLKCR